MSTYTTGEIARLCDVTVRTVQYYDKENLLHPSEVSEGGRRLYSEEDVARLKEICMLKSLGVSLAVIREVMFRENGQEIFRVFLEEQENKLTQELKILEEQRKKIRALKEDMKLCRCSTVKSQEDIENMLQGKKRLRKTYIITIAAGVVIDLVELAGILSWVLGGKPWLFIGMWPFVIAAVAALVRLGYQNTAYICPECHEKFKPNKREWFWASHTAKLRKLTCVSCGYKGFCIETYSEPKKTEKNVSEGSDKAAG